MSWLAELTPDAHVLGLVAFGDTVKQRAFEAVAALHARGIEAVMVTGDSVGAANAVAKELGIDRVFAEILPGDKADVVARLKAEGKVVAMVGDGINDAPALASADVGIAMATGTDVAMHTAGVTLMRGDPVLVSGRWMCRGGPMPRSGRGCSGPSPTTSSAFRWRHSATLSPVLAGAAMALSSVSVVVNALTLRGWKPGRKKRVLLGNGPTYEFRYL